MSFLFNIIASPLFISIITTFIVMGGIPFLLNYIILPNFKAYSLIIMITTVFVISFIYSSIISLSSSISECNRYRLRVVLINALKQAIYHTIIYIIIIFIPIFKSGFIDIGGNTIFWNSLGESFIMALCSVIFTIINYFTSKQSGCELTDIESDKQFKKMEKKLNSRKKKPRKKKISIVK